MKRLVFIFTVTLFVLTLLAGCSKNTTTDNTQPTTVSVSQVTTVTTTEVQETSQIAEETTAEVVPDYTAEENELEIIPQNTQAQEPAATEKSDAQSEETLPGLDDIIDEPIELPFVPIN